MRLSFSPKRRQWPWISIGSTPALRITRQEQPRPVVTRKVAWMNVGGDDHAPPAAIPLAKLAAREDRRTDLKARKALLGH